MTSTAPTSADLRFCIGCGYALASSRGSSCPECGRAYDPADPRTTAATSRERRFREGLRRATATLTWGIGGVGCGAVLWGLTGGDSMFAMLAGLPLVPVAVILIAIAAMPWNPVSMHRRLTAVAASVLLISTSLPLWRLDLWPLRLSIALHRAGLERIAAEYATTEDELLKDRTARTGILGITGIRRFNGNLGLQLSGDRGGGVFLVKAMSSPASRAIWMNTNWEIDLDDGWWLVYQD